jgi:hypothetical protein
MFSMVNFRDAPDIRSAGYPAGKSGLFYIFEMSVKLFISIIFTSFIWILGKR